MSVTTTNGNFGVPKTRLLFVSVPMYGAPWFDKTSRMLPINCINKAKSSRISVRFKKWIVLL